MKIGSFARLSALILAAGLAAGCAEQSISEGKLATGPMSTAAGDNKTAAAGQMVYFARDYADLRGGPCTNVIFAVDAVSKITVLHGANGHCTAQGFIEALPGAAGKALAGWGIGWGIRGAAPDNTNVTASGGTNVANGGNANAKGGNADAYARGGEGGEGGSSISISDAYARGGEGGDAVNAPYSPTVVDVTATGTGVGIGTGGNATGGGDTCNGRGSCGPDWPNGGKG